MRVEGSGRKKGTQNKVTKDLKRFIESIINQNASLIQNDLESLDAKERLYFLERLFSYIVPKQQAQKIDASIAIDEKDMREFRLWQKEEKRLKSLSAEELQEELDRMDRNLAELAKGRKSKI